MENQNLNPGADNQNPPADQTQSDAAGQAKANKPSSSTTEEKTQEPETVFGKTLTVGVTKQIAVEKKVAKPTVTVSATVVKGGVKLTRKTKKGSKTEFKAGAKLREVKNMDGELVGYAVK